MLPEEDGMMMEPTMEPTMEPMPPKEDGMMMDGPRDGDKDMGKDMMMMQVQIAGLLSYKIATSALSLFRYKPASTFADGAVLGTNWWQYANLVGGYGNLVGASMSLLIFIAMEFMEEPMLMTLMKTSYMMMMVSTGLAEILRFWSYEQAWRIVDAGTAAAGDITSAENVMDEVKVEMAWCAASEAMWQFEMWQVKQKKGKMMDGKRDGDKMDGEWDGEKMDGEWDMEKPMPEEPVMLLMF